MDCDLDACFKAVVQLAREAGAMIKDAFDQEKRIETKSCATDLVTETDKKVERFIISSLRENFPTHSFIGEESVAAGEKCNLTDNPTWIIDPIDGTTNFVHCFPFTCISIALVVQKETEIGLVYNPILDEMFTARRNEGSFLNDKPIHVTNTDDLSQALILAEFGSSRNPEKMDLKFKGMRNVIKYAHGIRSIGSCAVAMVMVAKGNGDGYYEYGVHCWDMAAGILLVKEAGGVVKDTSGGPVDLMSRRILVAGTEKLALQLAEQIVHVDYERD